MFFWNLDDVKMKIGEVIYLVSFRKLVIIIVVEMLINFV